VSIPPSVVVSKGKVSLADHLDLRNLPLATTPGGTNFALKALHPSEHTIKTARIPGGNSMSVALACDMVETIPITTAGASARIIVSPSIAVPTSVYVQDGATSIYGNFYNSAFGGAFEDDEVLHMRSFVANLVQHVQNYRITSQSATVELIAPALADQGTITAGQFRLPPKTLSGLSSSTVTSAVGYGDLNLYDQGGISQASLLQGTHGYTAQARDGIYLPLKLTKVGKWYDTQDLAFIEGLNFSTANVQHDRYQMSIPTDKMVTFPCCLNMTAVSTFNSFPMQPKLCGDNFGAIFIEGMAANVAIRIRVRQVVEITASPGTLYAPLLESALPPDPTCLKMYSEISARMADGYPASYNDLGKLRDIIMGIGKKVLPYVEPALDMLSKMPGPVGAVASVGKQLAPVAKSVVQTVKAAKKRSTATKK